MKKKNDTEWLETSTALIRFSKEEMQNIIVALVLAENSARTLSNFDYAKPFENLRKDIIKIKDDLIRKEEGYEENKTSYQAPTSCETCE
jgi:aspartate carbamoyltransferase catalytic subunit